MKKITFVPVRFNEENPLHLHDFEVDQIAPLETVLDMFKAGLCQIPGKVIIGRRTSVIGAAIVGIAYYYEGLYLNNDEWMYARYYFFLMVPSHIQELEDKGAHWSIYAEDKECKPA